MGGSGSAGFAPEKETTGDRKEKKISCRQARVLSVMTD
jgi:hypothetical protein